MGARRRWPAGRGRPAVRQGGSGAWSSFHSPDGPDDPGRGAPGDGHPVQPDDAQEHGLVGVGGGNHERVPSLDGDRAGNAGRGQVVPGGGLAAPLFGSDGALRRGSRVRPGSALPRRGPPGRRRRGRAAGRGPGRRGRRQGRPGRSSTRTGRGQPDAHRPPFPIPVRAGCGDGSSAFPVGVDGLSMAGRDALLPGTPGRRQVGEVDLAGDGRGDLGRGADRCGEAGGVDGDLRWSRSSAAGWPGWTSPRRSRRLGRRLGAGDRGRAGRVGGGGLARPGGRSRPGRRR